MPASPVVGGCWGGLVNTTGTVTARPRDCDEPHRWETYAVGQLAATTTTPVESAVAADPVVRATCTEAALRTYLDEAKGEFLTDVIGAAVHPGRPRVRLHHPGRVRARAVRQPARRVRPPGGSTIAA